LSKGAAFSRILLGLLHTRNQYERERTDVMPVNAMPIATLERRRIWSSHA
jgi:hypothetical protein